MKKEIIRKKHVNFHGSLLRVLLHEVLLHIHGCFCPNVLANIIIVTNQALATKI